MKTVDFYFDFGSPAAYLAWTQLPAICQAAGAQLVCKPMLLGGVFQSTGNRSPISVPAKGKYLFQDLNRYAARYAVPFRLNPNFPINTLVLMRGAAGLLAREPQRFDDYARAVFNAMWVDGQNLNDPQVVASVLQAAGFDPAAFMALVSDADVKERLKALTLEAVDREVFGAPTMFVGDLMFWGQDRLEFVKEALQ
ncbi:MAG: 2-hydroxychromene-2-carboxylate isomerase [Burkholderiaceae bacterium]|nr:2-hydroxychromene-2-carboxylate isomerase [Burkholderiaceae bacterium]